jgi:hypothetical protein
LVNGCTGQGVVAQVGEYDQVILQMHPQPILEELILLLVGDSLLYFSGKRDGKKDFGR